MPTIKSPIHEDGWKFVGIFALITLALFALNTTLGWLGTLLTGWCFYFFRNPNRVTPVRENLVVSPADGIVSLIREVHPPAEYALGSEKRYRISVFLNVFDVHVNRIPFGGIVEKIIYHPGKFFNASLDKASEFNERQTVIVKHGDTKIAFTQIAGLIARRIRCDIKEGQEVNTGNLYGLIRFGSRVDIYLPEGINPMVAIGQRMISGETVIADLASTEPRRLGVHR